MGSLGGQVPIEEFGEQVGFGVGTPTVFPRVMKAREAVVDAVKDQGSV